MFHGRFDAAREALEEAVAGIDRAGIPELEQRWYTPSDRISGLYAELGFVRFMQGEMAGAEPAFARIESRCETLAFPGNAVSLCYGRSREGDGACREAGQLRRAVELIEDVSTRAEQLGGLPRVDDGVGEQSRLAGGTGGTGHG